MGGRLFSRESFHRTARRQEADRGRSEAVEPARFGVAVLAGGRATRLPGKLALPAGPQPLVARVVEAFAGHVGEIAVAVGDSVPPALVGRESITMVRDLEPGRGPLGGLLAAFATMRSSPVFAVAGDAPYVDGAFAAWLADEWRPGDEALVPVHTTASGDTRAEYLAALYDREAFLREGANVLREGRGAMRLVVERLRTRYVEIDAVEAERLFTNVNTPEDYAAFRARLAEETT